MASLVLSFGGLFQVSILLVNAIAILSEDRFLARIGWGSSQQEPSFGGIQDQTSTKSKIINLISSVRTLMRSTCSPEHKRPNERLTLP
ncbi:Yos1-domain-containing protein [Teratosphaeria nubilosa]|uniref:Yos1-domain-containing protein n=1 Tax=Teratosphaeria nubilosa TaxID=161662 RepID=A0A6G1LHA6_9PEZI|nr:Yos1-domain-containing protein [Teratosphaeria nubilosa]